MFIILLKPEATCSQAGEVTQSHRVSLEVLALHASELVHYKHLDLNERLITFVKITQHKFMLHAFMHSKSIFRILTLFSLALCDLY